MKELLRAFFAERKIEYYAVLDYADCRESAPRIMEREGFRPRSVIMYLLPYYTGETVNLSRYAASLDYHIAISEVNEGLSRLILENHPTAAVKGYGDHSPIDERHAALISGLGIAGDNGLLINEKYGSYVFIGDLVTDLAPDLLGAISPLPIKRCEACAACKRACPTGILLGDGDDCLSAITQRKGELTDGEIALMKKHNTVWGCDLCQSVCPHNISPHKTPIEFFYRERIERLDRDTLAKMTDDEFSRRAFAWRKRSTVERNLKFF